MREVKCSYCGQLATLVGGDFIYPHRHDLAALKFWSCGACDAYVGCHKIGARLSRSVISDGTIPLGRLANAELRYWKGRAHVAFDQLWRSGGMTRSTAYSLLASHMGVHKDNAHIGAFDVEQCKKVVKLFTPKDPSEDELERMWGQRWGVPA